jgi:hypothetical protein
MQCLLKIKPLPINTAKEENEKGDFKKENETAYFFSNPARPQG